MNTAFASTTIPVRRSEGANCVSGLVLARAFAGGNERTNNERTNEEARSGSTGRAFASSAEPMCRPDHKAKKHGRPKSKRYVRRADRRARLVEECGL